MRTFKDIISRALTIRDHYAKIEIKTSGKPWGALERMQGFVGDVGDLMKLVMAKNNLRVMDDVDARLKHELVDCLWSVLVLADELGIDIEKEFGTEMEALENKIKTQQQ